MVGGLGRQKMGVYSYVYMLICSPLFSCEYFFTFQFCALMPKISKENFAAISTNMYQWKKPTGYIERLVVSQHTHWVENINIAPLAFHP